MRAQSLVDHSLASFVLVLRRIFLHEDGAFFWRWLLPLRNEKYLDLFPSILPPGRRVGRRFFQIPWRGLPEVCCRVFPDTGCSLEEMPDLRFGCFFIDGPLPPFSRSPSYSSLRRLPENLLLFLFEGFPLLDLQCRLPVFNPFVCRMDASCQLLSPFGEKNLLLSLPSGSFLFFQSERRSPF